MGGSVPEAAKLQAKLNELQAKFKLYQDKTTTGVSE